jgi:NADH dehydrogenase
VVPVLGRKDAHFQPVAAGVVAGGFVAALNTPAAREATYDVCGPERLTLEEMISTILRVTGRRRLQLRIPRGLARVQAALLEWIFPMVLRRAAPLNRDQLIMLEEGSTGEPAAFERDFQLPQTGFEQGIAAYLRAKPSQSSPIP